jgi:regulatory protein
MKARPALSIKGRALRYLSQREHCRAELERKLARHVEDLPEASAAEQIGKALDELAARDLLSERRAAEAVVTSKAPRFGPLKLRYTLRQRGVDPAQAEAALAAVRDTEIERARDVWRRKYGEVASDAAGRARQARFLASRGFGASAIRHVVRGLDAHGDHSDHDI